MPTINKHKTRGVRLPDPLWQAFSEKVEREGRTRAEVIVDLLQDYLGVGDDVIDVWMQHDDR